MMHCENSVLNPANSSALPNPAASSQSVAFGTASSETAATSGTASAIESRAGVTSIVALLVTVAVTWFGL